MKNVYHSGEKDVQKRAGVREIAEKVGRIIGSRIPEPAQNFLRQRTFVVIGSVDPSGKVWASVLNGPPGFVQAVNENTVRIQSVIRNGDPLKENLAVGKPIGLLAIEFSSKRRMRVNGTAEIRNDGFIYITSEQVYSNCPKYIQPRDWRGIPLSSSGSPELSESLTSEQQKWISNADTFFIASFHPDGGADVSHRGGSPGFVKLLDSGTFVWPDFEGNNMFQTLGNISVHPQSGLLFIDFESGKILQLTGKSSIEWEGESRSVKFSVEQTLCLCG